MASIMIAGAAAPPNMAVTSGALSIVPRIARASKRREWYGRAPHLRTYVVNLEQGVGLCSPSHCSRCHTRHRHRQNAFHFIGRNKRGAIMLRQKLSRGQVEARLASIAPCLIAMEAHDDVDVAGVVVDQRLAQRGAISRRRLVGFIFLYRQEHQSLPCSQRSASPVAWSHTRAVFPRSSGRGPCPRVSTCAVRSPLDSVHARFSPPPLPQKSSIVR